MNLSARTGSASRRGLQCNQWARMHGTEYDGGIRWNSLHIVEHITRQNAAPMLASGTYYRSLGKLVRRRFCGG